MTTKYLTRNMGSIDRRLRAFVLAPVAIVAAFVVGASSFGGVVLLVASGIALATAATGVCPTYAVFGIDTRDGDAVVPHRS